MAAGGQIYIRELTVEDVSPEYVGWLNDSHINQFMEVRHTVSTEKSCRAFVQSMLDDPSSFLFGIYSASDGRHIGNIKIGFINWHYKSGQISFFIGDKSCWGRGYASEAILLVNRFGFCELGLERLEAGCYESNFASLKALMRCGYSVEGFFRKSFVLNGRRESCFWLGLLKSETAYAAS